MFVREWGYASRMKDGVRGPDGLWVDPTPDPSVQPPPDRRQDPTTPKPHIGRSTYGHPTRGRVSLRLRLQGEDGSGTTRMVPTTTASPYRGSTSRPLSTRPGGPGVPIGVSVSKPQPRGPTVLSSVCVSSDTRGGRFPAPLGNSTLSRVPTPGRDRNRDTD